MFPDVPIDSHRSALGRIPHPVQPLGEGIHILEEAPTALRFLLVHQEQDQYICVRRLYACGGHVGGGGHVGPPPGTRSSRTHIRNKIKPDTQPEECIPWYALFWCSFPEKAHPKGACGGRLVRAYLLLEPGVKLLHLLVFELQVLDDRCRLAALSIGGDYDEG
jgi:hypothetical protein